MARRRPTLPALATVVAVVGIVPASMADSESRDNDGGYGHNPSVRRGIRIGSAVDGTVTRFIPDPAERGGSSAAEGVAVDHDGNVYGAEVGPRDVKKYIKR